MSVNLEIDGTIKWFSKETLAQQIANTSITGIEVNNTIFGLYSCNIQTNIVNKSLKIIIDGETIVHISLKGITSFEVNSVTLVLNTSDEIPYYLVFIDEIEAQNAYYKFEQAIDGQFIGCTDLLIQQTFNLVDYTSGVVISGNPYPVLLFTDEKICGKALNENDLINHLNQISNSNYSCTIGSSITEVVFSYYKYNEKYLPKKLSIINSYFSCIISQQQVDFIFDCGLKCFVCYDDQIKEFNSQNISFTFQSLALNNFDLFYIKNDPEVINLSNISLVSITGALPVNTKQFFISNSLLTDLSSIIPLVELRTLEIENTPLSSLPSFATGKLFLETLILNRTNITTLTGLNNLPSLILFKVQMTQIISTPDLSGSINLRYLYFIECDSLTTISSITLNTKLLYLIINSRSLTTFSTILNGNIELVKFELSDTNISTCPSLQFNKKLVSVILSNNDFSINTLETLTTELRNNIITQNGLLNLSNQKSNIDFDNIGDPFNDNIDYLQTIKYWTVIL